MSQSVRDRGIALVGLLAFGFIRIRGICYKVRTRNHHSWNTD